jgi:hypothetical protein
MIFWNKSRSINDRIHQTPVLPTRTALEYRAHELERVHGRMLSSLRENQTLTVTEGKIVTTTKQTEQPVLTDRQILDAASHIYNLGRDGKGFKDEDAIAYFHDLLSAQQAAQVDAKHLEWSDEMQSTKEIPYNHVIAQTPFGRILITWKGWKEHDCPTVDEHPVQGFFYAGMDLNDAKQISENAYFKAIDAAISMQKKEQM